MMDGVLCVGGCDKNMPGSMMAIARINVPAIFVYGGTIKPGHWKGEDAHDRLALSRQSASVMPDKISTEDFDGIERNACPTVGACGGQYTANTMSSSIEALGMSLLGSSQMAAADAEKARIRALCRRSARRGRSRRDLKPRDIITRKSIENAIALVMATGGSTNAVLHYLAIAPRPVSNGRSTTSSASAERSRCSATSSPRAATSPSISTSRRRAAGAERCCSSTDCCTATA